MASPSSQKAADRPISFVLDNQLTGSQPVQVTLVIRPEDLRRTEPGLQTSTATLGGAWVDDFGPGLSTISITGHTGWRGAEDADGEQSFLDLREQVWNQWHVQRAQAVAQGQSPDQIKLIFVDTLNDITAVVAPGQFQLMRSRSRPLLYQYSIAMTVISDTLDRPTSDDLSMLPDGTSTAPDQLDLGVESLSNSADTLATLGPQALLYLPASDGAIGDLMTGAGGVFSAICGASDPTVGSAAAAALAISGANLLWSYIAATGLTGLSALPLLQGASAFANAACVLANALSGGLTYTDLSGVEGASSCSSTLVGQMSPYLGENPFETLGVAADAPFSVSIAAQEAMATCAQLDPALGTYSTASLVGLASTLNGGVTT